SAASFVVAFDRDDEGGEVAVADDLAKLFLGFEHAGRGPAQRHLAGRPMLHVALGVADDLDHRFAWVGRLERALEVAGDAEPGERQASPRVPRAASWRRRGSFGRVRTRVP